MAKTLTETQKNEKIAALLTKREALERELKNTEQSHKRNKLISQIETTEEKIKKVRTGETWWHIPLSPPTSSDLRYLPWDRLSLLLYWRL